jgi:hypothetical protein
MKFTLVNPYEYAPLCLHCGEREQDYTLSNNNTYFIGYCPGCWEVGKSILSNEELAILHDIADGGKYYLIDGKSDLVHPLSVAGYLRLGYNNETVRYGLSQKGKSAIEDTTNDSDN